MKDEDTSEELVCTCGRWLSRDEDDHEICRELPVSRPGEQILPGEAGTITYTHIHHMEEGLSHVLSYVTGNTIHQEFFWKAIKQLPINETVT